MAYSRNVETITAVYDGERLVLQQPVDWPVGKVVEVTPHLPTIEEIKAMTPDEAWEWLKNNPRLGGGVEFDRGDLYP